MKRKDWNDSLLAADKISQDLNNNGIYAKPVAYTMYDGRRGIKLVVYDCCGNPFIEMASGTHEDPAQLIAALKQCANRIEAECL